jgi:hypothetical protein
MASESNGSAAGPVTVRVAVWITTDDAIPPTEGFVKLAVIVVVPGPIAVTTAELGPEMILQPVAGVDPETEQLVVGTTAGLLEVQEIWEVTLV